MGLSAYHARRAWEAVFVMLSVVAASIALLSLGCCVGSASTFVVPVSSRMVPSAADVPVKDASAARSVTPPAAYPPCSIGTWIGSRTSSSVAACRVCNDEFAPNHGGHCVVGCALALWRQDTSHDVLWLRGRRQSQHHYVDDIVSSFFLPPDSFQAF